jgi:hypothetical protein
MHQFFICNENEVDLKLKTLTMTETSIDGWIVQYVDKKTNEKWVLTRYHAEYHGGGVPVLKRLPEPTIGQLIDIAMSSLDINDIVGASVELSEREKYQNEEFRGQLLDQLTRVDTSNLNGFEKDRLRIIIYESNLYDSTNRREILGDLIKMRLVKMRAMRPLPSANGWTTFRNC